MESKLILAFTILIVQINARSYHLDTNWGDSDTYDWEDTNNIEISNTLAKPNFLDLNSQSAAKSQQANWMVEILKEFLGFIPKGILIVPDRVPQGPVEQPRDEHNRKVRPWTARVPVKYLGKFPYNFL